MNGTGACARPEDAVATLRPLRTTCDVGCEGFGFEGVGFGIVEREKPGRRCPPPGLLIVATTPEPPENGRPGKSGGRQSIWLTFTRNTIFFPATGTESVAKVPMSQTQSSVIP